MQWVIEFQTYDIFRCLKTVHTYKPVVLCCRNFSCTLGTPTELGIFLSRLSTAATTSASPGLHQGDIDTESRNLIPRQTVVTCRYKHHHVSPRITSSLFRSMGPLRLWGRAQLHQLPQCFTFVMLSLNDNRISGSNSKEEIDNVKSRHVKFVELYSGTAYKDHICAIPFQQVPCTSCSISVPTSLTYSRGIAHSNKKR